MIIFCSSCADPKPVDLLTEPNAITCPKCSSDLRHFWWSEEKYKEKMAELDRKMLVQA